ncbi:MAG: flavodoxin family protein [Clostridia bacterium]|nr:flavodoxin family protein [Clostridia bacterium]
MKVILINGSPHTNGCTHRALLEVANTLNVEGINTEIIQVGDKDIRGCNACGYCHSGNNGCVYDDIVNEVARKFEQADGLIIGSPVYYASANGTMISFLDRLFYSTTFDKTMKIGASVVSCRRAGNTATFDILNKYFGISSMPIVTSKYWNQVHGASVEDVEKDLEGLQTMRVLGRNMAFLLKSIALGKSQIGLPIKEQPLRTNFIR